MKNDTHEEEFEDTKGVVRNRISKNRQHKGLEFEDTKGVVRNRISKKNNTMAKRKSTKEQTTIYKT